VPTSVALACPGFGARPRGIGTVRGWTGSLSISLDISFRHGPVCSRDGQGLATGLLLRISRDLEPCLGRMAERREDLSLRVRTGRVWLWVASVRGVQGCQTQGGMVEEARRRVIDAMGFFVDDARTTSLVDDVKVPRGAAQG
jgi:predicted RNase H-like HicB family nuclease